MIHCLLLFKLIASNAIASVVSIVLQNHFHNICIFSKKIYNKTVNFTRSCMCVHSKESKFGALHMLKINLSTRMTSEVGKIPEFQKNLMPEYLLKMALTFTIQGGTPPPPIKHHLLVGHSMV